ncbi:MAG: adenosine kinase [Desulfobacterales bacterium]
MNPSSVHVMGVGSPVVDFVAEVPEAVLQSVPGVKGGMELVDADRLESLMTLVEGFPVKTPGGSAGNTTFALARLGMSCAFMGKLGDDANGVYYKEHFRNIGGDCSRFKRDGGRPTASCLSLVTPDSERTMRTDLGAAMGFGPEDVSASDFEGCRHVHVEGYLLFNPDLLLAVLDAARAAGCSVSLDLGSFEVVEAAGPALPGILDEYVDIVFANETEAAAFCGASDPDSGLSALGNACGVAAVKIGSAGAWLRRGTDTVHVPAIPAAKVVDTTGAGDYWAAGFLFGHLNGYSLTTSGRLGSLLGKHVVETMGAFLAPESWDRIILEATLLLNHKEEIDADEPQ